jgi:putative acetyltransferase
LDREEEECRPMKPQIIIRRETGADIAAITEVTVAAFKTLEISNHTEQFIPRGIQS